MRLLNAETFELEEFFGNQVPPYAILSHCWQNDEITFLEMESRTPDIQDKPSWFKIKKCCSQALEDGLKYVWIDTCCIDKRSSAELSEAINSMFRWYENARHCYAFLEDVGADFCVTEDFSSFKDSRWFTRGWTLQELIAPVSVRFYSENWTFLGTRVDLSNIISEITGIPEVVLKLRHRVRIVHSMSIAKRMSWASRRGTTREEDMAYCLMGIFEVNMPLLYGEGSVKAFIRLQEEILKTSLDHSLFAWWYPGDYLRDKVGALATSPAAFSYASNIVPYHFSGVAPYSMANKGLRLELPLLYTKDHHLFAILRCHHEENTAAELALPLIRLGGNQYARVGMEVLPRVQNLVLAGDNDLSNMQPIYIDQYPQQQTNLMQLQGETYNYLDHKFWIKRLPKDNEHFYPLFDVYPSEFWDRSNNTFGNPDQYLGNKWKIMLLFKTMDSVPPQAFVVTAGFSWKQRKWISWCVAQKLNRRDSINVDLTKLKPDTAAATSSHEINFQFEDSGSRRLRVKVYPERLIGENVHTIDINIW